MSDEKLMASVMGRIDKTESCWLWTGARFTSTGYGKMTRAHGSKGQLKYSTAHRLVYELLVGPLPAEMHLHHLCGTKLCVNPEHLQVVTRRDHANITFRPRRLERLVAAYGRVMARYAARQEVQVGN